MDAHSVPSSSGLRSGILEGFQAHGAGVWQALRLETVDRRGIVSVELTLVDGTNCGDRGRVGSSARKMVSAAEEDAEVAVARSGKAAVGAPR